MVACTSGYSLSCVPIEISDQPDTLCLAGRSGYFSFGLTSWFEEASSSKVVYKWILNGHDKEWHISDRKPKIHYAGLHPGNYLLTIRAFSNFYRKGLAQKEMLIIVRSDSETNKGVLFLYLFLLLLSMVSVWSHIMLFRDRIAAVSTIAGANPAIRGTNYTASEIDFVKRVNEILETHCCDTHFTLYKLYKEIGMSRSSFNNKWKALGQKSPKLYIYHARLDKAKLLLGTTSLSVTDISERCGFCDVKYFREVFKSEFDMTPSEYRKLLMSLPQKEKEYSN